MCGKGLESQMDESLVALIGAILGVIVSVIGIMIWVRPARRLDSCELTHADLQSLGRAFSDLSAKPDTTVKRTVVDARGRRFEVEIHIGATSELTLEPEVVKAGSPRTGDQSRTVEVESQNGSRSALRIDPDDADSVEQFVDTARRLGAERVLAVH